jgi:hypothetical protein
MTEKQMLKDMYWNQGMILSEIAEKLGWSYSRTYYKFRRKYGILTHRTLWQELDIQEQELRDRLNTKWSQIRQRVAGDSCHDPYGNYCGKQRCSEQEFVDFCNQQKEKLLAMWHRYLQSDRDLKHAVSIDRIDPNKGYTIDNLQFVTYGYNSWKDHLRPVRVTMNGETRCFGTPTEAGRYWDVRTDDVVEVLRGSKYNRHNIDIESISTEELLEAHSCESLQEYYHRCFNSP